MARDVNRVIETKTITNHFCSFIYLFQFFLSSSFLYKTLCQNRCVKAVTHYVFESPNPILQLVWIGLVGGGYLLYLRDIYPHMGPDFLPTHVWLSHILVAYTFGTFALACYSNPGVINKATVASFAKSFPFDNLLYKPKVCETCLVDRPARSKHCRICGYCVARFDHRNTCSKMSLSSSLTVTNLSDCPWINGCVGEHNVRYFLLMLFSTSFICLYESWLSYQLCVNSYDSISRDYTARVRAYNRQSGEKYSTQMPPQYALGALLREHGLAVPLGLFCFMMGLVVFAFGSYHVYLVVRNTTTNETFKWSDVHDELRSVARRRHRRQQLLARRAQARLERTAVVDDKKEDSDAEVDKIPVPTAAQMSNIYNRGVWNNFSEVIWPPSLRANSPAETREKKTK